MNAPNQHLWDPFEVVCPSQLKTRVRGGKAPVQRRSNSRHLAPEALAIRPATQNNVAHVSV